MCECARIVISQKKRANCLVRACICFMFMLERAKAACSCTTKSNKVTKTNEHLCNWLETIYGKWENVCSSLWLRISSSSSSSADLCRWFWINRTFDTSIKINEQKRKKEIEISKKIRTSIFSLYILYILVYIYMKLKSENDFDFVCDSVIRFVLSTIWFDFNFARFPYINYLKWYLLLVLIAI